MPIFTTAPRRHNELQKRSKILTLMELPIYYIVEFFFYFEFCFITCNNYTNGLFYKLHFYREPSVWRNCIASTSRNLEHTELSWSSWKSYWCSKGRDIKRISNLAICVKFKITTSLLSNQSKQDKMWRRVGS